MNILDRIIANKQQEVAKAKSQKPIEELKKISYYSRDTFSLKQSLRERSGIISEFKRQSPSRGVINEHSAIEDVVQDYNKSGVSALSILTDKTYFGGTNMDVFSVRDWVNVPILRKEFIVDKYQIYEAKAIGADAILLIAAVLNDKQVLDFSKLAKALGLEVLLEVHNEQELSSINAFVDCVGVNNRNLKDFKVDIQNSIELSAKIPNEFIKISESGISSIASIETLKTYGFEGFLIGEIFMKTENPGETCKQFISQLQN